jgi:membrane associated rhomboid family serine protease
MFGGQNIQNCDHHPSKENFFDMWKYTFCPDFTKKSFTFIFCAIIFFVWIIELIVGSAIIGGMNEHFFLGAHLETHQMFGMRMPFLLYESYHLQRLFLPCFLHYGFGHIAVNVLCIMMIGFMVEKNI